MTALISPTTSLASRQCVASTRSRDIGTVLNLFLVSITVQRSKRSSEHQKSEFEEVVIGQRTVIRVCSVLYDCTSRRYFQSIPPPQFQLRDLELSLIPADGTTWTQAGRTHPEESRLGLPGISPNGFKAHPPLAVAIARLVKRQLATDFHENIATQLHLADQHETERMLSRTVPH